ncbi:hypothetical protein [Kitasatospora sp. NPDC050463]|uniref:hypothetical protein n=1 Tax=Kitasatospora sp. NPDC050463 TaxID=3155786 RepID=UPI0033C42729
MAGEFTAKYGPDGQLVEQTYPGGIVRKDTVNAVGEATGRTSDNKVIWAQSADISTQGQVAKDTSSTATRTYQYDRLGRLVKAEQSTVTTGCVTRQYTFDAHSNRLSKQTSPRGATSRRPPPRLRGGGLRAAQKPGCWGPSGTMNRAPRLSLGVEVDQHGEPHRRGLWVAPTRSCAWR